MKRVGSPSAEGQVEPSTTDGPPPPKRTKASKACLGCRHQKTRCDPGITTPEGGMRCKRCSHFNLRCSLEGSPPRPKATILPSISDSFPRVPSSPPPPPPPLPHANSISANSGLPPQHSRRSSPPRNFGPNTLRGPSPPPGSAPPNMSGSRDRHYGSDSSAGAPSPGHQQFHPPPRSEYPPAPPIQHVQAQQHQPQQQQQQQQQQPPPPPPPPQQQQQQQHYSSSSSRYTNTSSYRESFGPAPPTNTSPNASSYHRSDRSRTPQQQHYQSGSNQHHHHSSQSHGPNYHQNSGNPITTGAWTPRGISVSPHVSAPVPPVPGPSPRSSTSMGSRGGTPRVPAAYIVRTDSSSVGGGAPGGPGEDPPPSLGHSASVGGPQYYQPPPRPLAPPSPPHNLRNRKAPIDAVATASISLSHGKPPDLKEAHQIWGGPLSFMRDLLTPITPTPDVKPKDLVAAGIVSSEDAQALSRIFITRFAPWLTSVDTSSPSSTRNAPSYAATSPTPKDEKPYQPATSAFLQAAQWTLSARHLPTPLDPVKARAHVALRQRLAKVLQSLTFRALLGLDDTLPALRAFIILATWTGKLPTRDGTYADLGLGSTIPSGIDPGKPNAKPNDPNDPCDSSTASTAAIGDEEEEWLVPKEGVAYDGEMFLGAAMRIAAKMHLEVDVQMVLAHKQAQEQEQTGKTSANVNTSAIMSPAKAAEALDRCRVMYTLSVLDAFVNIGKGRLCSTRVSLHLAEQIFGAPATLATKPGGSADARLVFQCNLLDIALRALDLCTSGHEVHILGAEQWANRVNLELKALNHWHQKLAPVTALTDPNEMVQVITVTLQFHFLKLLLLFRSFRTVRRAFPHLAPILASASKGELHEKTGYSPSGLGRSRPVPTPVSPVLHAQQSANAANAELDTDQLLVEAAVDWIRSSRECSETIMIESLALRRLFMNDEPAILGEKIMPALAYVPDHVLYALSFGPIYTVKAHLLSITILQVLLPRHETTRSLLERTIDMFREAVPKDQDAEKRAKVLEERLRAASHMEITHDGCPTVPQSLPFTADEKSCPPPKEEPEDDKSTGETKKDAGAPHPESATAASPPTPTAAPASTSLVGRCADVLTALGKLWDARTAEWHANESAGLHRRRQPALSEGLPPPNGHPHSWKDPRSGQGDEEEDELASDIGDAPLPGQSHHSPYNQQPMTPSGNSPYGHNLPSAPGSASFKPGPQIGPDELFGTQFNFDLASFWDGSFFDPMFMFDTPANNLSLMSFSQAGGSGGSGGTAGGTTYIS